VQAQEKGNILIHVGGQWDLKINDLNEVSKAGYTWKEIKKLAQNRTRWKAVSMDLHLHAMLTESEKE